MPVVLPWLGQVREVFDTLRVAARLGTSSLSAYVISMSQQASDVLAVELLQKEARMMVSGLRHETRLLCGWLAGRDLCERCCGGESSLLVAQPLQYWIH
jgi:hypothetical protein